MGGYYSPTPAPPLDLGWGTRLDELEHSKPNGPSAADCKKWALRGEKVGGLIAVAGYATWGEVYTEHWWCVDAKGKLVDASGLSLVAEKLYPLSSQKDDPRGVCLAYEDECHLLYGEDEEIDPDAMPCAWCEMRATLDGLGFERGGLDIVWRPVIGSLIRENVRMRCEIASLRSEFERFSKKGGAN